jgi:hypothetical protein
MTFSPILPVGGYAGYAFLKRTMASQTAAFTSQTSVKLDEAYFREKIGSITTAEQLVGDARLMRISLAAFGLEDDLPNKFFIKKVLEEGTLKPDALANKLTDKRYAKMSNAFGFALSTPSTKLSTFADKILSAYESKQFAVAVGGQNEDMRLALNAEQELPALASSSASENSKWYTVLGNAPLRAVFERAFGLPKFFGAIDIDKQVETMKSRSEAAFGSDSIDQFTDSAKVDKLVRQFLVRSELETGSSGLSRGQIALTLLQNVGTSRRY